jgi:hypothetical protein
VIGPGIIAPRRSYSSHVHRPRRATHLLDRDVHVAKRRWTYEKLRDVPLRYRVAASLLYGGMSPFLFGVFFALVRQADHAAANQAWAWAVVVALIALVAAVGAFFGLVAWGALSDPKSRLGTWVQKRPLADGVQHLFVEAAMLVLLLFGFWFSGMK